MIVPMIKSAQIKVNDNGSIFTIFSNERIILQPNEKKLIYLPYRKEDTKGKFLNFMAEKSLTIKGLQILWHNLNDESSNKRLEFLIYNNNIDYSIIYNNQDDFRRISGSIYKLDIFSNIEFGKIYIVPF